MDHAVITYTIYLTLSICLTIWVARTLFNNGRLFLVECFKGNEELADSVNHLLVVGFYLVNIGFVALFLKVGIDNIEAVRGIFETVATKVGVVMLVLGGMHFFNIYIFSRARRKATLETAPPPVAPSRSILDAPNK